MAMWYRVVGAVPRRAKGWGCYLLDVIVARVPTDAENRVVVAARRHLVRAPSALRDGRPAAKARSRLTWKGTHQNRTKRLGTGGMLVPVSKTRRGCHDDDPSDGYKPKTKTQA